MWNGERWTVSDSVTVLEWGKSCATDEELELFCVQETKKMLEKLEGSLSRSLLALDENYQIT